MKTRKRKRGLSFLLAVLVTAACLLTGCGAQNAAQSDAANSGSDDLQHLTVVLDWYPNALHAFLYEAEEKGYFAEEGLDVDIQPVLTMR